MGTAPDRESQSRLERVTRDLHVVRVDGLVWRLTRVDVQGYAHWDGQPVRFCVAHSNIGAVLVVQVCLEHGEPLLTDQPATDAWLGKTRRRRDLSHVAHAVDVARDIFRQFLPILRRSLECRGGVGPTVPAHPGDTFHVGLPLDDIRIDNFFLADAIQLQACICLGKR